jgi:hypothetical protein
LRLENYHYFFIDRKLLYKNKKPPKKMKKNTSSYEEKIDMKRDHSIWSFNTREPQNHIKLKYTSFHCSQLFLLYHFVVQSCFWFKI